MAEIRKGMLARSRAGHDAGTLYVITEADDTYVSGWPDPDAG